MRGWTPIYYIVVIMRVRFVDSVLAELELAAEFFASHAPAYLLPRSPLLTFLLIFRQGRARRPQLDEDGAQSARVLSVIYYAFPLAARALPCSTPHAHRSIKNVSCWMERWKDGGGNPRPNP